ncbi:MAG TPA: glycerol dehydratase reactivase beta/small subunit family protein [Actinomycetospora sp.]|nr:glycerol dehydratase reactivase beta/small subunit family protein [Actinomycetospora sp.]
MSVGDGPTRPVVLVAAAGTFPAAVLRELRAGLEEEGVPHELRPGHDDEPDPTALAHRVARDSPLEVGVGLTERGIAVHHGKLPAGLPVAVDPDVTAEVARRMGHDAARVVTGIPLKLVTDEDHAAPGDAARRT